MQQNLKYKYGKKIIKFLIDDFCSIWSNCQLIHFDAIK